MLHITFSVAMADSEGSNDIYVCAGHESWVLSVDCHPSGTAFATGSSDATVKLWDLQTRTCSQTVTEHSDQVLQQTFSTWHYDSLLTYLCFLFVHLYSSPKWISTKV